MAGKTRKPDWESIEKEYRLGQKSTRTIADQFKISHTAINKRAKKFSWVQDRSDEIREKTKAALISFQREVSREVSNPTPEDINAAVQTNIDVIVGHRKQIGYGRKIAEILSEQLQEAAESRDELEETIEAATIDEDGKKDLRRRNSMLKAISLPAHSGVLRDLSIALKNLIPLERQAFGIDERSDPNADKIAEITINFVGVNKIENQS